MARGVKLPSFPKMSPAARAALITAGAGLAGGLGAEVVGKVATERLLTRFPGLRGKAKARGRPTPKKPDWVRQPRQLKKLASKGGGGAGDEPRDDHGRWTR